MVSLEKAAALAHELPEVTEGEHWGQRSFQVAGKTFAWERGFSKADVRRFGDDPVPEGPILAVRVADLAEKEAVLAEDRPGFFTIPHFDGYTGILIQLRAVRVKTLREALLDAWLAMAPQALADQHFPPVGQPE